MDYIITHKVKKSKNLLFPLLDITRTSREATFLPENTYLWWENVCGIDCGEFLVHYKTNNVLFEKFEEKYLLPKNPISIHKVDEGSLYVFDLSKSMDAVDLFLEGKYSKFDEKIKAKIRYFWGDSEIIKSSMPMKKHHFKIILHPEYYFEEAAKELGVPLEYLKQVGELMNKPDKKEETWEQKTIMENFIMS